MESLNLVKVDLKIKYNTIFNSKDNTKKILIFLFVLILAIIPIEFSIIKNYYILKNINMESIILIAILNIESLLIFITTFIGVSNNFFLEHNVSTLLFYPIKSRSILFSKSILEYLKGFAIGLIGFVFFITYGILNNCSIYYYLKVLILQLIIPIICVIYIFNFLLYGNNSGVKIIVTEKFMRIIQGRSVKIEKNHIFYTIDKLYFASLML